MLDDKVQMMKLILWLVRGSEKSTDSTSNAHINIRGCVTE